MLYALWSVAGALVLLWLLAVSGAFAASGWIHLLPLVAVLLVTASLFTRPRMV